MMTNAKINQSAGTSLATRIREQRAARARRAALAGDLANFNTPAALLELSAMLDRYPDDETHEIRQAVEWTRAA
jgi:hypothetical protein